MPELMSEIFSYLHEDPINVTKVEDGDDEKNQEIIEILKVMLVDDQISAWLTDPRPDLNGRTPKQLIMSGENERVLMLVRAWAAGSFG
jgi:hypothetical protein